MPIKLSQVGARRKSASVEYDGETVDFVYKPSAFTPRVEARLNEAQVESTVSQEVAQVLSEVLVSWDVLGDDGKPLNPDIDLLMEMPLDFLTSITQALGDDMRPKEQSV